MYEGEARRRREAIINERTAQETKSRGWIGSLLFHPALEALEALEELEEPECKRSIKHLFGLLEEEVVRR